MVQIAPDETRDVITVSQDGVQLLEVVDGFFNFPGTDDPEIGRVRLVGGPVRGARGETLGMSWNAARFDLSQCEVGTDRDKNTVICVHPEEGGGGLCVRGARLGLGGAAVRIVAARPWLSEDHHLDPDPAPAGELTAT